MICSGREAFDCHVCLQKPPQSLLLSFIILTAVHYHPPLSLKYHFMVFPSFMSSYCLPEDLSMDALHFHSLFTEIKYLGKKSIMYHRRSTKVWKSEIFHVKVPFHVCTKGVQKYDLFRVTQVVLTLRAARHSVLEIFS